MGGAQASRDLLYALFPINFPCKLALSPGRLRCRAAGARTALGFAYVGTAVGARASALTRPRRSERRRPSHAHAPAKLPSALLSDPTATTVSTPSVGVHRRHQAAADGMRDGMRDGRCQATSIGFWYFIFENHNCPSRSTTKRHKLNTCSMSSALCALCWTTWRFKLFVSESY